MNTAQEAVRAPARRQARPEVPAEACASTEVSAAPRVPLYARIAPKRVELPQLGGCIELD